jgi:hypothetical protein
VEERWRERESWMSSCLDGEGRRMDREIAGIMRAGEKAHNCISLWV